MAVNPTDYRRPEGGEFDSDNEAYIYAATETLAGASASFAGQVSLMIQLEENY